MDNTVAKDTINTAAALGLFAKIDDCTIKGKALGVKNSTWSIFKVEDWNEVPFPDMVSLVYAQHWGQNGPLVRTLRRPATWEGLWKIADAMIRESGDDHHIFIEAFVPSMRYRRAAGVYELITGS